MFSLIGVSRQKRNNQEYATYPQVYPQKLKNVDKLTKLVDKRE